MPEGLIIQHLYSALKSEDAVVWNSVPADLRVSSLTVATSTFARHKSSSGDEIPERDVTYLISVYLFSE